MKNKRELIYFGEYFLDFFNDQSEKVKDKINYVLYLVRIADRIPEKFFKYLTGTKGLYEIRIEFQSNTYRIFCCFGEGNLIVLLNGFKKKSQKTPLKEIEKALKIKKEYLFKNYKKL